jgi:hypothetical protein
VSHLLAARLPPEMREVADEEASSGTVDCLVRLIYDEQMKYMVLKEEKVK